MARNEYDGVAYRQCHPDHTNFDETVRASVRSPYRFNPKAEFGVLYVSLEETTARAELERQADRIGVSLNELAPRVMLELRVKLKKILDLTDDQVRCDWGVTPSDLASGVYARCHEVSRVARQEGYEAILYPSATGSGENLAIYYDQLTPGSTVDIVRTTRLVLKARRKRKKSATIRSNPSVDLKPSRIFHMPELSLMGQLKRKRSSRQQPRD